MRLYVIRGGNDSGSMDHFAFFPRLSGVAVLFGSLLPTAQTLLPTRKERESMRHTHRQGERETTPHSHPEGIELSAKHLHGHRPCLSVRVERETEEEQTTFPDNNLLPFFCKTQKSLRRIKRSHSNYQHVCTLCQNNTLQSDWLHK